MIKAVIFDMDGTLVDTTPLYLATYMSALKSELGLEPEEDYVREKFGKRATDIMKEILDESELDQEKIDVTNLINVIRDDFLNKLDKVPVLPGVYETLDKLKGEYKLGLATSSRPYAAMNILELFKLKDYFQVVITGNDVKNCKPDPEIFLLTAKRLKVKPNECVVVEDAVYGIKAARAAGMKAVAVCTGACTKEELEKTEPDVLLDSLNQFDSSILN